MKKIRSIISFYSSFALASVIVNILSLSILIKWGIDTLTAIIWFKNITLAIILFHINSYKTNDFYYYKNLGISKTSLWIWTIILDYGLFILSIYLTMKIV